MVTEPWTIEPPVDERTGETGLLALVLNGVKVSEVGIKIMILEVSVDNLMEVVVEGSFGGWVWVEGSNERKGCVWEVGEGGVWEVNVGIVSISLRNAALSRTDTHYMGMSRGHSCCG